MPFYKIYNLYLLLIFFLDSLIYYVQTDDLYYDLVNSLDLLNKMDTANLSINHLCYTMTQKKIQGYFSDETNGRTILEFATLRAKSNTYSLEGKEEIKANTIRRLVIKNHKTLEQHKHCLFGEEGFHSYRDNISMRSYNHVIKPVAV